MCSAVCDLPYQRIVREPTWLFLTQCQQKWMAGVLNWYRMVHIQISLSLFFAAIISYELHLVYNMLSQGSQPILQWSAGQKYPFTFDKVFNHEASQPDVFTEISQLVQSALDGYKVIYFASFQFITSLCVRQNII